MNDTWTRSGIADLILERIRGERERIRAEYAHHTPSHFIVDDLLPKKLAAAICRAFPDSSDLMLRKSLRERKYVSSQMDRHDPLLEETVYAFQDPRLVAVISEITGIGGSEPDEQLYAGGISVMGEGHFLNPHIDNSHDKDRNRYRALNLLYYASPGWGEECGGNFELWPHGPRSTPLVIPSFFNRLVAMATTRTSWHSVSKVRVNRNRACVSNYYFSHLPPEGESYFHVTSFRGRPEQRLRDSLLRGDAALRSAIRKFARKGLVETKHYYRRNQEG